MNDRETFQTSALELDLSALFFSPTDEDDEQGSQSDDEVDVDFEPAPELVGVDSGGATDEGSESKKKDEGKRGRGER